MALLEDDQGRGLPLEKKSATNRVHNLDSFAIVLLSHGLPLNYHVNFLLRGLQ